MPASFRFLFTSDLWVPLDMDSKGLGNRGSHWANAVGRLKPGVTPKQGRADLVRIASNLEKTYPNSNYKVGATLLPLRDDMLGDSRNSLVMMLSAVGLVLLIACANVANLLLSRAISRQKEMAIRSALGAGRPRIFRQLLTESLLLGTIGGALGLGLGWGIIAVFSRMKTANLPRFNAIEMNGAVLAFTFGLALVTGVVFGLIPALQTSRPDLHEELKGGAGASVTPGKRRRFTSDALVVCEMALALLLLVSAGLLLKDFAHLRNTDIGVRPAGVWTASTSLPDAKYSTGSQKFEFARKLLDGAAHIPGVDAAAISNRLPLEGGSNYYAKVRGRPSEQMSGPLVETHDVSPDYFRAMGIRLLRGRTFTAADVQTALAINLRREDARKTGVKFTPEETNAMVYPSVVNEAMVRHFWPNENPIGQMFNSGSDNGPWMQVIGVVGDVRQWSLTTKPIPEAYEVYDGGNHVLLVLHTSLPPGSLTTPARRVLRQIDSSLPLFSVRSMDQVIDEHAQGQRFLSLLVGSFAALAMLLAAIGIYGVLSYAVTQRMREIGIRLSLGATRGRVMGEVLREGMRLAVVGVALGIGGALAAGKVLQSLLHDVEPRDPSIFAITGVFLAAVALIACYLPARRAARLDPVVALRYE
jgi:putative ABC transport system permease protein